MFGELLGAWAAQVWLDQGRPDPLRPRRARARPRHADGRRAAGGRRRCRASAPRRGSGSSRPARRCARARPRRSPAPAPRWAEPVDGLPAGAAVVVANEFFDALPIRQFQRADALWRERLVGLDGGRLAFALGPAAARRRPRRALPARCPTARSSRSAAPARRSRPRSAPGSPRDGRRGARHRLRRLGRAPATRCRRCGARGRPIRWPSRATADLTAHVRLRARSPRRRGRRARTGRWRRARSSSGSASRRGRGRWRAAARRGGRRGRRGASALDPPRRNGKPLPGSGADAGRRPAAAGIRAMTLEILTSDLLAGTRARLLHPPRRRLVGHLRRAELRAGLVRPARGGGDEPRAGSPRRWRWRPTRLLSLHQVHSTEVVVAGPDGLGRAAARRRRR